MVGVSGGCGSGWWVGVVRVWVYGVWSVYVRWWEWLVRGDGCGGEWWGVWCGWWVWYEGGAYSSVVVVSLTCTNKNIILR